MARSGATSVTAAVAALVAEQFPGWAGLPVRAVRSQGTDNALFRLGDRLAAAAAEELRSTREQQLQMVVQIGHRADR